MDALRDPYRVHETPGDLHGHCGGKDEILTDCTCPDPVYSLALRLRTGANIAKRTLWCFCCRLPIDREFSFGRSIG